MVLVNSSEGYPTTPITTQEHQKIHSYSHNITLTTKNQNNIKDNIILPKRQVPTFCLVQ
jgi:hypothetical protein